jgi:hypothetical protein
MSERHDVKIARRHVSALDDSGATTGRKDRRSEVHPHPMVGLGLHLRDTA